MSQEISEKNILFKLTKIFVAQYLSSVHNIKGFEQESINIITNYILKIIQKISVQTKRLSSLQGRKQSNCLHLIDTLQQTKIIKPIHLINFLVKQREQTSKGVKFEYIAFQNLSKRIFETETEQINGYSKITEYSNITAIPYNYNVNLKSVSLSLKSSTDESFKKPEQYTYKIHHEKIEKNIKNVEQLGHYSARQTRKYLGILNLKNDKDQEGDNTNEKPRKRKEVEKSEFDMINYV